MYILEYPPMNHNVLKYCIYSSEILYRIPLIYDSDFDKIQIVE